MKVSEKLDYFEARLFEWYNEFRSRAVDTAIVQVNIEQRPSEQLASIASSIVWMYIDEVLKGMLLEPEFHGTFETKDFAYDPEKSVDRLSQVGIKVVLKPDINTLDLSKIMFGLCSAAHRIKLS